MENIRTCFTKRKILGSVTYEDFITRAIKLNSFVHAHFPSSQHTVGFNYVGEESSLVSPVLANHYEHLLSLDKFTELNFEQSRNILLAIRDSERPEYLVSLAYRRQDDKELFFSGEGLEQFTLDILESLKNPELGWNTGDGYQIPGIFNSIIS